MSMKTTSVSEHKYNTHRTCKSAVTIVWILVDSLPETGISDLHDLRRSLFELVLNFKEI